MKNYKLYPPAYFNFALFLIVLLHFLIPIEYFVSGYWKLIGIIPFFVGTTLNLIADKALKNSRTTVKPDELSRILITNGIFKVSRNPMYAGMTLILVGIAVFLGSISPFFVIPLFVLLLNLNFIVHEEKMLYQKFGDQWLNYKKRTRKWL